ncbi:acyltransferase [Enterococcus gallinarum]|uniref:acyltransferase n=1 Tax=Enterococcus gallinarum TaxID=1353 RepID=UPI001FCC4CD5|nr:acyltransferase [Enterococcus gallinarum]
MRLLFFNISKFIMRLIYNKEFLVGKWFEYPNIQGYKWCWKCLFGQKILRNNGKIPFPVSNKIIIGNHKNLVFDVDDLNNFQHYGCYFQNYRGKITLGRGTYVAPNVGLITENHNLKNLSLHDEAKDINIGENCWIGMNSVILPGVSLGNQTIVGAGSIVTKSFSEGNCVIAGNPAILIRKLD